MDSKEEYERYGLTYKRGILMYGEPGTGKTSIIRMLHQQLQEQNVICVYSGRHVQSLVIALQMIRSVEPDRMVVVFAEDLEDLARHEEESMLALLDGELEIGNVVFVATTNHLDRIPDRIKNRPSRFDIKIEIGVPSAEERRAYIVSRFKGVDDNFHGHKIDRMVEETEGMTFAAIKELFILVMVYEHAPSEARDMLIQHGVTLTVENATVRRDDRQPAAGTRMVILPVEGR
jgi:SpoVK/Ycf46/Vps4 family AAA+-type ATPase